MIRRWLTRLLYLLLTLFVVASAALYVIVGTAPGTRWLLDTAIRVDHLPLHFERSQGSLLGGLDLYGITWHDASARARIAQVRLRWRPLDLLIGNLHLDDLSAAQIVLILPKASVKPTQTGTAHPAGIDLPLSVTLARLDLRDLIVVRGAQSWRIGAILGHGRLQGQQLHIDALHVLTPQGGLQLVGSAKLAPPYANKLRLAWNWRLSDGTRLAGHGTLSGTIDRIDLMQRLTAPFSAQISGHVSPHARSVDLTLAWQQARWPFQGPDRWRSPQGTLQLAGTAQAYTASLRAKLEGSDLPTATLRLRGSGDSHHFQLSKLLLKTLDGEIDGQIAFSRSPALHWSARLHGNGINPGAHWRNWPGRLGFELNAKGGARSAKLELKRLAGTLRGLPVLASASVALQQKRLQIHQASLQAGSGQLQLSGEVGAKRGQLAINLDLPKAENLLPSLHGGLRGRAKIDGPWHWPRITADLRGRRLAWHGTRVRGLELVITPASQNRLDARLKLDNVQRGNIAVRRIQAQILGTLGKQRLTFDASGTQGRISLAARGGIDSADHGWSGSLTRLRLAPSQGPAWQLAAPATVRLGTRQQQISASCLRPANGQQGQVCLQLKAATGKLDAAADVRALPLTLFGAWLPSGEKLAGQIDGSAHLTGPPDALNGQLQLQLRNAELKLRDASGEKTLRFAVPQAQATLHKGAVQATVLADLPQQKAKLQVNASVGKANAEGQRPLTGSASFNLPDISVLQPFVPQLHALSGIALAQISLGGTLAQPHIRGTASLKNAGASIPATGIRLRHVEVQASLPRNSDSLNFQAKVDSGSGTLQAKGKALGLFSSKKLQIAMQVAGHDFEAVNLPQVQAWISPQLLIDADPARIRIRGKVEVPKAKIRVHRLPPKAVSVSSDTVVVGRKKPRVSGPTLDAKVELILGNQVIIDAMGLSGGLRGNLLVSQQGSASPTADGTLQIVNGSYAAYGLNLTLSRGLLTFAGPVNNPGLDIVAQRQTGSVTAMLSITGTLQTPRSAISADPTMSQADALSWLITGHGINDISRSDAALLLKAIYSMNVSDSGGGLVSQIEQRTGLNEISVQGGDTLQQSALVLGKYLTPELYLRYTTGLFQRMNTLSLTYKLSRHLSVEVQSGASQALNLLYQIQFGAL